MRLSENDDVKFERYEPDKTMTLNMVKIEIDFYQKTNVRKQFDADEMANDIQKRFSEIIFAVGHQLPYKFEQSPYFRLSVKGTLNKSEKAIVRFFKTY